MPWYPGQCLLPSPQLDASPCPKTQAVPFSMSEMTQRTLDPAQPLTRAQNQIAFERATLFWRWASQVALVVKNLPANAGDIRDVGLIQEDPVEEDMATHSSILAWEIPWTEESGWLQSMGLQSQA